MTRTYYVYSRFAWRVQAEDALERYYALGIISESEQPRIERRTDGGTRQWWCVLFPG